ncbi:MAG: monovalent cation/H+ antiporter subunit D family protein [Gammaproteobacteria bacterium]
MSAIATHLPALQVVAPLLSAPACALLVKPRAAWALTVAVSVFAFICSVLLLGRVLDEGVIVYELGGWPAPWGIEYRLDVLNTFMAVMVSGISALSSAYARHSIEREIEDDRIYLVYTAWLLCLTGSLGILVTGDAFNLFVFLEIASLSSYVLVSQGRDRRALVAAFRYLLLGTVGATFILIGVGLLYAITGTLNMADLALRIPQAGRHGTLATAFAFIVVGAALKAALLPGHGWLPEAYARAPSAVSAFLAGTATKIALYVGLRFAFTVFGPQYLQEHAAAGSLISVLALAAVLYGSSVAMFQSNAKLVLAFSSVAQIGFMVLGISWLTSTGLTGGIVHMFNHALMKAALFLAVGCVVYRLGRPDVGNFAGLGKRMPWTMAALALSGLSLIGVPLTAGFIGKWYLLSAALERGWWPGAVVIVVSSLMAVVYIGRLLERAYFAEPHEHSLGARAREAPVSMLVPLWLLVIANFWFGIHTEYSLGLAARAAEALLGVAP